MQLPYLLFTGLFIITSCTPVRTSAPPQSDRLDLSTPPATESQTMPIKPEAIEGAIELTRARLQAQRRWLETIKAMEAELSRSLPDYGW